MEKTSTACWLNIPEPVSSRAASTSDGPIAPGEIRLKVFIYVAR